jgi:hypothetical protein
MEDIHEITVELMSMRVNLKFYHWRTKFYAAHKSSDDFLTKFDENVDKLVECLQGGRNKRIKITGCVKGFELYDVNDTNIVAYLNNYKLWFTTTLPNLLDTKKDVDILALRDEIVGDMNQFIYLLSFS